MDRANWKRSIYPLGLGMALISSAWTTRAQDTLLDSLSLQPSAWAPSKISDTPVQFQLRYYMDAAGWNGRPIGLWSDGTTMYVTDWLFSKLFAYNIAGPRDYAGDINSLAPAGNRTTRGVWSDGTIIWVCDDFEDRIFAYKLQSGERQEDREFDTLAAAGNDTPAGLWSDGSTMWVTDDKDEKIYAYDLVTTFRKPQLDFSSLSAAGNHNPRDLWSNGTTLWVADTGDWSAWGGWVHGKVFAYDMDTRQRDAAKDFDFQSLREVGATSPAGLWSNGSTLYVSDWRNHRMFSTPIGEASPLEPTTEDFSRSPEGDFAKMAEQGNMHPSGIWSNGTTQWIADMADDMIYAYDIATGLRAENLDFETQTLQGAGNGSPTGLWSNGFTLYVTDDVDDKIYAYDLNVQINVKSREINTLGEAGNQWPRGLWSNGTTMWVADWEDDKLYAYDLKSGGHTPAKDIETLKAAGNEDPSSIWSDGTLIWVADWEDDKVYAYDLNSKERVPERDFDSLRQTGNLSPSGMWSDGHSLWITDFADAQVYAYRLSKKLPSGIRSIRRNDAEEIVIDFIGILKSSTTLDGDFLPVENAVSPFIVTPSRQASFFVAE
ncbi:MAG: hypothetical protein HOD39_09450 [Verrucomicrobia bacterium]|nr:hypothetical protein [Verrucomicrobiota bacterium]MBT5479214.1 hypothetical protein [Verrucomicrobiota bacterium]MBT6237842.1 hypothetical protein [Verrucomicrobiota bacterium]MBT6804375.1 hypothetical protein [Verrucomicrobiota bacterium]